MSKSHSNVLEKTRQPVAPAAPKEPAGNDSSRSHTAAADATGSKSISPQSIAVQFARFVTLGMEKRG